jgi:hypothetical protein
MQAFRARDALNAQADEGTVRLHNWYQNCPGYDDERDECGVTAALESPYNEDILDWLHHGIDLHPNTGSEE